jgi:hypothetical protein
MTGRKRVAVTLRRLEVRIGQLLGPTKIGERHDLEPSLASEGSLKPNQRSDFRKMAEHSDVVAKVTADSTDEDPPGPRSAGQQELEQVTWPNDRAGLPTR